MIRSVLFAVTLLVATLASPSSAQDAFPVTIEHVFGETVIEQKPERILTISWMSQEAIIALGETPVAMQRQGWGGNADGYLPWTIAALEARGETLPPVFDGSAGLPFEEILGHAPDLIFAPYGGYTQEDYDRLSAIAPTVAYRGAPFTVEWRYVVETAGRVLGKSEEAAQLLQTIDERFADYRKQYPILEGATFIFGNGSNGEDGTIGFYIPGDPRVGLLTDLGLVPSPSLASLPTDSFAQQVSLEHLSVMEADVFAAWYSTQEDLDKINANPLFSRWTPIADANFVPVVGSSYGMALSAPSLLSIPWVLDRFVPELAAALEQ